MREESGERFIFVTGAPGSKWSAIAQALTLADGIDNSDLASHRQYAATGVAHLGNYFGPGMEYGDEFDHLDQFSKQEILTELLAPFRDAAGFKLLKSHMFARHLKFLRATFPAGRFVLVYRGDDECLDWWLDAGGFEISFPDYSWYREVENMRAQIAIDNAAIREFVSSHRLALTDYSSFSAVVSQLGLSYSATRLEELAPTILQELDAGSYPETFTVLQALDCRVRAAQIALYHGAS